MSVHAAWKGVGEILTWGWEAPTGVGKKQRASGTFANLGHKRLPFPYENTPFGAYMKILYRLTDPSLQDGAFLSAIFTLNTRRGQVVRVTLQRSCPSRHATIGRAPFN